MDNFNFFIYGNNQNINNDKDLNQNEKVNDFGKKGNFLDFKEKVSSDNSDVNLSNIVKSMFGNNSADFEINDEEADNLPEENIKEEENREFTTYGEVKEKLSEYQNWLASGSFNIYSDDIEFYYSDETNNLSVKLGIDDKYYEYQVAPDGTISSDNSHKVSDIMNLETMEQYNSIAMRYGFGGAEYSVGKDNEITINKKNADGAVKTVKVDKHGNVVSVNDKPVEELRNMNPKTAKKYLTKGQEENISDEKNNLPNGIYNIDEEGFLVLYNASDGKEYKYSPDGNLEELDGYRTYGSTEELPEELFNEKQNETIKKHENKLYGEYKRENDGSVSIMVNRTYGVHINIDGEVDYIIENGEKIPDPAYINAFFE